MKNSLLVFLASLASVSFSQEIRLGPELGTNLILLEKTDLGRNYHLGWFAGGSVEYEMTDYLSLRSGIYFSHRKKMYETADTVPLTIFGFDMSEFGIPGADFNIYSKTKGVVSLFGLEAPLMLSLNYKNLSVFAGPYVNIMVGAWTKEHSDTYIPFLQAFNVDSLDQSGFVSSLFPPAQSSSFTESSSKANLHYFDYGFKSGISYQIDEVGVNLYYVLGARDYRVYHEDPTDDTHHYVTLSLRYNFGVGQTGASSFGD